MAEALPGIERPSLQALPQIGDRMTFLYLEHCQLNREDGAILIRDERGTAAVPAAAVSVLLLGPGTNVTHRAMELIGDTGVSVVWVGEHGVRYYASGRPLTHHARLLQRQAELVCNQRGHLAVARKMYEMRFPDEDVSTMTMQQLRGKEGSRVRKIYRQAAKQWNIPWNGREFDPDNYSGSSKVNQALSAGNACLYGLALAVITALGCSPGLGFVHVGHENSFSYDIADLYKAELVIPLAFEIAAQAPEDIGAIMRRRVRDAMASGKLLERMVHDIRFLLSNDADEDGGKQDVVYIWDDRTAPLSSGVSYGKDDP